MASTMKPIATRRASWPPPPSAWLPARSGESRIVPAPAAPRAARVRVSRRSRDSQHAGPAAVPSVGLRGARGKTGYQDGNPQLRTWRRRHHAFLGNGATGRGSGAPRWRARVRRDRLRRRGAGHRAPLAGTRLLPDDLRSRNAAADHIQPGGRTMGAGLRLRPRARHAGIPRASSPRRRALHSAATNPLPASHTVCAGCRCTPWRAIAPTCTPPPDQPEQRRGDALSGSRHVDRRPASFRCAVCSPPAHHADRTGDLPGRADPRFPRRGRQDRDPRVRAKRANSWGCAKS